MFGCKPVRQLSLLFSAAFMLMFLVSKTSYAEGKDFHSPCFNISLASNISLTSKTEDKDNGFYRYVFSSAGGDDAELQIRVIVSNRKPEAGQSIEGFQIASIGAMSAMFMDANKLYEYIGTPKNKKVLSEQPYQLKIGSTSFAGATMYFGNTDASFLVTRANDMTYAFTLVSKNSNDQIREDNLKALTEQLQAIKLKICSE